MIESTISQAKMEIESTTDQVKKDGLISRQKVLNIIDWVHYHHCFSPSEERIFDYLKEVVAECEAPTIKPEPEKYEYHYDHTDCIWYRPEARNRCPTTCAQYRDGWNDAMNYIFRDGKGYRPYRRDKQYGE